jgi:virulence factor
MADTDPINLAVIGGGGFAERYHLPALVHLREQQAAECRLNLRGLYRRTTARARELVHRYGFDRAYASLDELLADAEVNAVVVIVPPEVLDSLLPSLAATGLPIFCEKPPGADFAAAQRFSELVKTPNLVAFNRRFAPFNHRFKEMVGELDHVFHVEGSFLRSSRHDSGFTLATASHWINYLEYLFGRIVEVRNQPLKRPGSDRESRLAALTFADGLTGLLRIFPLSGAQSERLEVHSPTKILTLRGPLSGFESGRIFIEEAIENPDRADLRFGQTIIPEAVESITDAPRNQQAIVQLGFVAQFQEFFDAIRFGTPTRSNFQNALNTMRIAQAIQQETDIVA